MEMSEEELFSNLNDLSAFADDPDYATTMSLFMERYASVAPNQALDFVLSNFSSQQGRRNALNIVLHKWSQTQPILALDWYTSNSEEMSARFNPILAEIFTNLAKQDQNLAINYLEDYLGNERSLSLALKGITENFSYSSEYLSLLDKTAHLDSSQVRSSIVTAWLSAHSEDTLDWFDSLPDSRNKTKLERSIFVSYMHSNPNEAANWYMSRASSDNIQARAHEVIRNLSYTSHHSALKWLQQQTDINTEQATQALLSEVVYRHPNFAIENLHLLESDKEKADISATIFSTLKDESESKARLFFESSPYKKAIIEREIAMRKYKEKQTP